MPPPPLPVLGRKTWPLCTASLRALASQLCCKLSHTCAPAELTGRVVLLSAAGVNCGMGPAGLHQPLPFVQAFPDYEGCSALLFPIFQI